MVADDDVLVREGVASVLDRAGWDVVGLAGDGAVLERIVREHVPEVAVVDIRMPPTHTTEGLDTARVIREEFVGIGVVVLSAFVEVEHAVELLGSGDGSGYLLKSSLRTEMLDAIHNVHRGRRHVHGDVAAEIALHVTDDALSEREAAVLRLVAVGKANKEIAHLMSLSEETVKAHLKNIFAKLDVADRTHAVTVAARRGIIEL